MADQPVSPSPAADDARQRLDLALRLLAISQHVASDQLRLLPGKLPDDLPFTLPLPAGARVLGGLSVARSDPGAPSVIALVETSDSEERGTQRLSETLEAHGWAQDAMFHMRGGFVQTVPGYTLLRFRAAGDYTLTISPLPGADAHSMAFSITAQREPPVRRRPDAFRDLQELIPPLFAPPGATQQGGGSDTRRYVSANLTTSQSIAEVMANYDGQLERGGWRRRSGAVSGPVGWSYWSFADDMGAAWRGSLVVSNDPDRPREYVALLQIEAENDGTGHAGWTVHSDIVMG